MMRFTVLASAVLAAVLATVLAYPSMNNTLQRVARLAQESGESFELIGDLIYTRDSALTATARDIKRVITKQASGESDEEYAKVPAKDTEDCRADTCCIWKYIADDMTKVFRGESGRCVDFARGVIRLGFHDAAGFSKRLSPDFGGADGSIILAAEEMQRPDNLGLSETVDMVKTWYGGYRRYGITYADLIQMAANVAHVVCPLGPRIKTYVGRKDSNRAAPPGLIPSPHWDADTLIELFQDKTIEPRGLVALMGAHTTSQQRFVDPSRAGDPQDTTPGVWDVDYYRQTLNQWTLPRVFKFQSDIVLSLDSRTRGEWQAYMRANGQLHWNADYAREYVRLSLLGVFNINNLTDCTKVLPPAITGNFQATDQSIVDQYLKSATPIIEMSNAIRNGSIATMWTERVRKIVDFWNSLSWRT